MAVLLIDQDGPLADFDGAVYRCLERGGYDTARLVRTQWDTVNDVRRCLGDDAAELVNAAQQAPGFYRHLEIVPGAVDAIRALAGHGIEIVVCTAPSRNNPTCASDKIAWLAQHLPELRDRYAIVRDKTLIRGTLLLDDKPDVHGSMAPSWRHVRFLSERHQGVREASAAAHVLHGWEQWTVLRDLLAGDAVVADHAGQPRAAR